jgi:antitoxin YefM
MKEMHTTYRLNANELDEKFIESLKALFKDRDIEIIVNEVDETAYLLRSEANKERLLKALENVEKGENLVEVQIGDLQ